MLILRRCIKIHYTEIVPLHGKALNKTRHDTERIGGFERKHSETRKSNKANKTRQDTERDKKSQVLHGSERMAKIQAR